MKEKTILKITSSALLCTMLAYTAPIYAFTKDETVYSKLDKNGKEYSTIVSDHIKNEDQEKIINDISDLLNIENVNGEEKFDKNGNNLVWSAEGSDIYYQGESKKELPIEAKVKYELNGEEISASEIAGKFGKVKITIEYINKDSHTVNINGKSEKLYTPFVVISAAIIDNSSNRNIEITNGKVIDNGTKTAVFGISLPGMKESLNVSNKIDIPEKVEITMESSNFEMGNIITYVTPKVFEEEDLSIFNDLDEIYSKVNELQNSSRQIEEGAKTLQEGTATYYEKSQEFNTGVEQVSEGVNSASKSYETLDAGIGTLNSSAKTLNEGASKLNEGAKNLDEGVSKLNEGVSQGKGAALTSLESSKKALADGIDTIIKGKDLEAETIKKEVIEKPNEALKQGLETKISEGSKQIAGATLDAILQSPEFQAQTQIKLTDAQRKALVSTLETKMDTTAIEKGIDSAINEVETKQKAGIDQINNNKAGVKAGLQTFKEESAKSIDAGKTAIGSGFDQISAGAHQISDGTKALKSGTTELYGGTQKLEKGTKTLNAGSKEMKKGLSTLDAGAGTLKNASEQLTDGAGTINEGAVALSEGITKFNREGIDKVCNYINGDLKNVSTRLEKLQDLSKEYNTFTMLEDGTEGNVKFIMIMDSVKKEESSKQDVVLNNTSEVKEKEE